MENKILKEIYSHYTRIGSWEGGRALCQTVPRLHLHHHLHQLDVLLQISCLTLSKLKILHFVFKHRSSVLTASLLSSVLLSNLLLSSHRWCLFFQHFNYYASKEEGLSMQMPHSPRGAGLNPPLPTPSIPLNTCVQSQSRFIHRYRSSAKRFHVPLVKH